jgi:hypothetical protein
MCDGGEKPSPSSQFLTTISLENHSLASTIACPESNSLQLAIPLLQEGQAERWDKEGQEVWGSRAVSFKMFFELGKGY